MKPIFRGEPVLCKIRDRIKSRFRYFALLPVDHYRALGISNSAGSDAIEMAYVATLRDISKSRRSLMLAFVYGQTPARLERARDELLNPAKRAAHDREIAQMTLFFGNPPG
jgi:hypothetical protein